MANDEKAQLYRRIVQQNSEQQLLERMRIHGFWPQRAGLPQDPPAEAAERARIEAELEELRRTQSAVKNPESALHAERKRRWEESKKRRAERKAQKLQEQHKRREAYEALRQTTIVHAGAGVSGRLQETISNEAELRRRQLPVLHIAADLAREMGMPLSKLRWLTYHRRSATLVHYHRYEIEKKTGGVRCISAPRPALKQAQGWVLEHILGKLTVEPQAHGFVPGRSIVTNALPHVGRAAVINLDLKDFFPTITFRRVQGLFRKLGYSGHLATLLALLCTEPPRVPAELDDKVYHVALGQRVLPQGACTSPAITNALCRRLDRRLDALARRHGFAYTRYADDLTLSGDNTEMIGHVLRNVRYILKAEGFTLHPTKSRLMRRGQRQEVTGVTVNVRPGVSRQEVRTLRAILHNAARHGLESQNREKRPNFAAYLKGRVEFVRMVDPQRGRVLRAALQAVLRG
ncbi:MAG: RNA-directed DNA polymerase [Planctomycetia bacterium]|nr:RNA-directed DNA polymerase [Planctomycetia bacterium]